MQDPAVESSGSIAINNLPQDIFQLAMEAAPHAMIVVAVSGHIVLVNAQTEKLFGYTKSELVGQLIEILLPAKFHHKHVALRSGFFLEVQARSMGAGRDLFGVRKDGSEVPLEIGLNPIHTDTQHLVVASIIDITERKRVEEKMSHMQKMESLGILTGGIAHDFNNLLTSILGYAELGLMDLPEDSIAFDHIQNVIKGANNAADLVKQLLAYSGQGWQLTQSTRIADIIEEMGHLLQVSISKKCTLKYSFEKDTPPIDIDGTQLRQVIMNLIINASDAMRDRDGVIHISTGLKYFDESMLADIKHQQALPNGKYVFMKVADNGSGMDHETAQRIFDPFFTTKSMGRGLGLAAVQGIVHRHRGAIKLSSELGKGTTFTLLFPPSTNSALPSKSEETSDIWRGKGLVLVVDDEQTIRLVARTMLEKMGFDVITADDGEAGVKAFEEFASDISFVLLDMTMPNMNGAEAFDAIQKIKPDAKVILSSGYSEQSALNHFVDKGLKGFLQKPYRYDDLLKKVKVLF